MNRVEFMDKCRKDGIEKKERTLAFLDTVTVLQKDDTINTRVFRKESHTDHYLSFNSNHPLLHKRDDVRTEQRELSVTQKI